MSVTAWSYSRWACYELCPLQFKLKFLDKLKVPVSPAMERGDIVHKGIAAYIMGRRATPPLEVALPYTTKLIEEVRNFEDKVVEQQWGYTIEWEPTGWFAGDAWFRNIVDAAVLYEDMTADALDWKTGKRYGSNADQMELNGIALLRRFKPAVGVTTRMVYIDSDEEDSADFAQADVPKLMAKWGKKVAPMFTDTQFLPRPNDKCRFCPFGRSKGGQCRFG